MNKHIQGLQGDSVVACSPSGHKGPGLHLQCCTVNTHSHTLYSPALKLVQFVIRCVLMQKFCLVLVIWYLMRKLELVGVDWLLTCCHFQPKQSVWYLLLSVLAEPLEPVIAHLHSSRYSHAHGPCTLSRAASHFLLPPDPHTACNLLCGLAPTWWGSSRIRAGAVRRKRGCGATQPQGRSTPSCRRAGGHPGAPGDGLE